MSAPVRTAGVVANPRICMAASLCLLLLPFALQAQDNTVAQQLIGTWALAGAATVLSVLLTLGGWKLAAQRSSKRNRKAG